MDSPDEHSSMPAAPSPNPVVCDLAIEKEDVCQWSRKDAFRHLYANWRDAIRSASNLQGTPALHLSETHRYITVSQLPSSGSGSGPGPGFIQLDKGNGTLMFSIANGTSLRGYMEYSIPATRLPPAGLLKGVMAMVLAGYRVSFWTWRERWEFFVNGEVLAFKRVVVSPGQGQYQVIPSDMTITIGPGDSTAPRRVERENLLRWLTVTLDITNTMQPDIVMDTSGGDLLLDVSFADHVYVDGIQLATRHAGLFHFGYHYRDQGIVSTDLELVLNEQEVELRCQVWAEAIAENPSLATLLVGLMRAQPGSPDVRRVDEYLGFDTVEALRDCLLAEMEEECLVCCETDDMDVITQRTNRPVLALPTPLWTLLHRMSLLRTWAEDLLYKAPSTYPIPMTGFSINIQRILKGLLQTDRHTASSAMKFVDYPLTTPSVYFDDDTRDLYISKYWLDFNAVHRTHRCRLSDANPRSPSFGPFRCDHVVLALYAHAVQSAARCLPPCLPGMEAVWVNAKCQAASELVEERPRLVSVRRALVRYGDLCVMWQHGIPPHVADMVGVGYHVILHREACVVWRCGFVHYPGMKFGTAPCGCPQRYVHQQRLLAVFENHDLNPSERYIPMVALDKKGSIYGVPPAPVAVTASDEGPLQPSPDDDVNDVVNSDLMRTFRESWQKTCFPVIFGLFTPPYGAGLAMSSSSSSPSPSPCSVIRPAAVGENDRLAFRFERHQYIIVQTRHPGSQDTTRYILYVHGVIPPQQQQGGGGGADDEGSLVVTMFSFLRTTSLCLFHVGLAGDEQIGLRELLLHYWNFENMGQRQDAVVIPTRDIVIVEPVAARMLSTFEDVAYTVDVPPDVSRTPYYCRFAIRCGTGPSEAACVMPVASHLLGHSKRWPEPRYCMDPRPSVIDLSPAYLGLAEGFCQAGARVDAAFGFDATSHHTWRARYPTAKLYDGPLPTILADIVTRALNQPPQGPPGTPRIVLLSIPEKGSDVSWEQTVQGFRILQIIPSLLAAFRDKPDFLVISFPPWIFLDQAFQEFFGAMYALLEARYAVHLKRMRLDRYGPVQGEMLVMVGSCVPSPIPWGTILTTAHPPPSPPPPAAAAGSDPVSSSAGTTILARIQDLNFINPRIWAPELGPNATALASGRSLVCKHPLTHADVYNHPTGLAGMAGQTAHVYDLNSALDVDSLRRGVRHYQRNDPLTVRELARIQGFPDDFIFLGGVAQQYADVLSAFPPSVARDVAARIMLVLREFWCRMGAPMPVSAPAPASMPMSIPVPVSMPVSMPPVAAHLVVPSMGGGGGGGVSGDVDMTAGQEEADVLDEGTSVFDEGGVDDSDGDDAGD